jgi:DNA-binding IclR family transcriptional regulator
VPEPVGDPRRSGAGELFAILDALVGRAREPWGVRELAEGLGASRTTVNRHLSQLVEHRLARQVAGNRYTVGPRLLILVRALHRRHPLFVRGAESAEALRDRSQATALISIAGSDPLACTVLVVREPASAVRYAIAAGSSLPTHAGAAGLAVLAEAGLAGVPAQLPVFTPASMRTRLDIESAIAEVRRRGGAVSVGQHIPDAAGVAVGVTLPGMGPASISVSQPRATFDASAVDETIVRVTRAARALAAHVDELRADPRLLPATPAPAARSLPERVERLLTVLCTAPFTTGSAASLGNAVGARSVATRGLLEAARSAGVISAGSGELLTAGAVLLRWAAVLGDAAELATLIDDDLRVLARSTGETVGFAAFDGHAAHVAQAVQSSGTVRYVLERGSAVPLHAGALGKAILAYAPHLLDRMELASITDRTISDREALRRELEEIRVRGWALGDGERFPDAYGVAAPVFEDGAIAGSVTVTVPRHRVDRAATVTLASVVTASAERISRLVSLERPPEQELGSGAGAAAGAARGATSTSDCDPR